MKPTSSYQLLPLFLLIGAFPLFSRFVSVSMVPLDGAARDNGAARLGINMAASRKATAPTPPPSTFGSLSLLITKAIFHDLSIAATKDSAFVELFLNNAFYGKSEVALRGPSTDFDSRFTLDRIYYKDVLTFRVYDDSWMFQKALIGAASVVVEDIVLEDALHSLMLPIGKRNFLVVEINWSPQILRPDMGPNRR
jgi:hypothetical protein